MGVPGDLHHQERMIVPEIGYDLNESALLCSKTFQSFQSFAEKGVDIYIQLHLLKITSLIIPLFIVFRYV